MGGDGPGGEEVTSFGSTGKKRSEGGELVAAGLGGGSIVERVRRVLCSKGTSRRLRGGGGGGCRDGRKGELDVGEVLGFKLRGKEPRPVRDEDRTTRDESTTCLEIKRLLPTTIRTGHTPSGIRIAQSSSFGSAASRSKSNVEVALSTVSAIMLRGAL
jgi:hypothetical protein